MLIIFGGTSSPGPLRKCLLFQRNWKGLKSFDMHLKPDNSIEMSEGLKGQALPLQLAQTSVLIDIILHDKEKKWLVCYERDGQDFYKKKADQIEVDSQANEFFDEFLKALKPKITEYIDETYSRDENMSEVKKEINVIKKLFISSSLERKKCTKNLAESLYLSI
jgi:hypothetical protein